MKEIHPTGRPPPGKRRTHSSEAYLQDYYILYCAMVKWGLDDKEYFYNYTGHFGYWTGGSLG